MGLSKLYLGWVGGILLSVGPYGARAEDMGRLGCVFTGFTARGLQKQVFYGISCQDLEKLGKAAFDPEAKDGEGAFLIAGQKAASVILRVDGRTVFLKRPQQTIEVYRARSLSDPTGAGYKAVLKEVHEKARIIGAPNPKLELVGFTVDQIQVRVNEVTATDTGYNADLGPVTTWSSRIKDTTIEERQFR